MMLLCDLEKFTPAVFVGETSGASPNGYGDSRRVRLPNTGLTVRVSTLYWQYWDPRDDRQWIEPGIRAPLTSEDYRAGRDPALEVASEGPAPLALRSAPHASPRSPASPSA